MPEHDCSRNLEQPDFYGPEPLFNDCMANREKFAYLNQKQRENFQIVQDFIS